MSLLLRRSKTSELASALSELRSGLGGIALLSACINVLVLASAIYLMLVYDRILPSQSGITLISLFLMVTVAYAFYGAFDIMRAHMLSDVGASVDRAMSHRVQRLQLKLAISNPPGADKISPVRDLDQIRGFLVGPGPAALIDMPWILFFLVILSLVHVWLGVATLVGALILAALTYATDRASRGRVALLSETSLARAVANDRTRRHAEAIAALGMRDRIIAHAGKTNEAFLTAQTRLAELTASFGGISKVFRLFLQSVVLSVGALLVIDGHASGGIIFAASILSGRALAPVDQAIANWRGFISARQSWTRLEQLLQELPPEPAAQITLPAPAQSLSVSRLALAPPGSNRIAVADVSLHAQAGDAVGVIGPSASGKSSLLRGILGVWPLARGEVRLDGATVGQWDSDLLGRHVGYLPQSVHLFAGSVAQNIARFDPDSTSDLVIAAAEAAGVHPLILKLPDGYDTQVGDDGVMLSAGQRQRIALARALYRDPFLVVLDEPNSNLDPEGENALANAIKGVRARRGIVLLVAHRLAILNGVNLILALRDGAVQAFGPRDEVLNRRSSDQKDKARSASGSKLSVVAERA